MERAIEHILFASRWLLTLFYLGLIVVLGLLIAKFGLKLYELILKFIAIDISDLIIYSLKLIDITLMGNLVVIMILAGYENFVSSFDHSENMDRPSWIGKIGFGDLKIKLITSIVAISAIQLLEAYMNLHAVDKSDLAWMIGMHVIFILSGLLLAWMDSFGHGGTSSDSASVAAHDAKSTHQVISAESH